MASVDLSSNAEIVPDLAPTDVSAIEAELTALRARMSPRRSAFVGFAAAKAGYDVHMMFAELGRGMEFAIATENATAFVRAVELRGKLTGILVDRIDARVAVGGFVLNVHGLNADRSLANEG
jgi:hypothetical protein